MSHHHDHSHGHHHHHGSENIKVAFFLNLFFTIIEIAGGFFTNSVAILSDALHDFGDTLSLGLAWYFQNYSQKGRDKKFSYGYKRFSLLGAIINSIVLFIGSIFIISEAIPRLLNPEPILAKEMIWIAILGVIINGAAVVKLKKGTSLNEKAIALHLLEDVLGWVAVLIGSILMYFFGWIWLDSVLSLAIAVFILVNAYKGIAMSLKIVMQGTPSNVSTEKIKEELEKVGGVDSIHDLHVWTMDGEYVVATLHVISSENLRINELQRIRDQVRAVLEREYIDHSTIEIHTKENDCLLEDC
ncbi:MAG: cobalt-zinc-cadmium efflux system protein [Arenicella sp.]|jgi:cobalt-zinc-cadmium efflux system protein